MRRIPALLCVATLAAAPASAVASPSRDPWSTAQVVEKLEWSTGKGRLGVTVMSLTPELRTHFGAPQDRGVLVAHVDPGTPAASAGIEVGDVIVEVHDQPIDDASDVLSALGALGKGEHAEVDLVRRGRRRTVDATLADDALPSTMWSSAWLHEWLKPFEQTKGEMDATQTSRWLDRLREVFARTDVVSSTSVR